MGSSARFVAALVSSSSLFCTDFSPLRISFASVAKLFLATSLGATLWITFVDGITNAKDLMARTTARLKAWVKAEIPDMDTFLSAEILTLLVAPFVLVLVSTYATVLDKQGLLEYELMFRFSLEFGRLFGCLCIAAFIFMRPFKHLILMQVILLLLGWASAFMFCSVFHGYFTLITKHCYESNLSGVFLDGLHASLF